MRIKIDTHIWLCNFVGKTDNDNVIRADVPNGLYTIEFKTNEEAEIAFQQLLENGYYDATNDEVVWNPTRNSGLRL